MNFTAFSCSIGSLSARTHALRGGQAWPDEVGELLVDHAGELTAVQRGRRHHPQARVHGGREGASAV
ncbi:hypothetical protein OHB54_45555 [Streptomyces sp. NBC_01007]|nr:hypothetical protein OHB54_45555 [Streptomyces sp. NBC_01007]